MDDGVPRARRILRRVDLIRLDDSLLDAAGMLGPRILRSLDAVHLAAAQLIAPELDAIVTYDRPLAEGALLLGFSLLQLTEGTTEIQLTIIARELGL